MVNRFVSDPMIFNFWYVDVTYCKRMRRTIILINVPIGTYNAHLIYDSDSSSDQSTSRKEMDMKRMVMVALVALVALTTMVGTPVYAAGKVNINTASKRRLESLPGIGSDIAALIIKYRREIGPFDNVAELRDIPGIGERRLEGLRNEVTVGQLAEKNL